MNRLQVLMQYYTDDPEDAFTCFALALENLKQGNRARACELFESVVRAHPTYTGTYYHLGKLYLSQGQHKKAREIFKRGIKIATTEHAMKDRAELQQALMDLENV